jgi:hypothetical protein
MLFDMQALFSDKQAVTSGTELGTNVLDINGGQALASMAHNYGTPLHDIGRGNPAAVIVKVDTTFGGGTSLKANLVMSTNSTMGSPVIIGGSETIAEASLVAGYQFRTPIQIPHGATQRYLGIQYVSAGTHTAGNVTAAIIFDRDSNYAPI